MVEGRIIVKKLFRNENGFTLVEMLVVVFIIALLALISIPIYNTVKDSVKETAFDAQVRELRQAAELHLLTGGGDAIWAPGAGAVAVSNPTAPHDAWGLWLTEWPENPLGSGDFVVEISGGRVFVSPGRD